MKKAVILGASSGIGKELARVLSVEGYMVGLVARRVDLLEELARELPCDALIRRIDLTELPDAMNSLEELLWEMGAVDLVIISAGTGFINPDLDWTREQETIDLNVSGFVAMANVAFRHFCIQGSGHLVGISSISAIRGAAEGPAYNASKAFVSSYLQGLQQKTAKMGLPITVTDIQPGLVDTAMAKGEGLFWVQSAEKAARQIYGIIKKRKRHGYVTKRWRLIAWALKIMPDFLYHKI
jgi:short-subunit dehydrogenase